MTLVPGDGPAGASPDGRAQRARGPLAPPSMLGGLPTVREVPSCTALQAAEADRVAMAELDIPLEALMENASRQVAAAARALLGRSDGARVMALAGRGNNGGDALGALRHLRGWGAAVQGVVTAPPERLGRLCAMQLDIHRKLGTPLRPLSEATLADADLLLDGLLGHGSRGAPGPDLATVIGAANRSGVPILAIDLPSGMEPDTGQPLGIAVRADVTVTLSLPKAGLLEKEAHALTGELLLADVGLPAEAFGRQGIDTRGIFASGDLLRVLR